MRTIRGMLLLISTVTAANGETIGIGGGSSTCAKVAQDYKQTPKQAERDYYGWAQGYMTGINTGLLSAQLTLIQTGDVTYRDLIGMPIKDQISFLWSYCDQHPLAPFKEAVDSLYATFPKAKLARNQPKP